MEKRGKGRVKKKYACPNPLFVKWLTEWKQEAAEKGLKLQYTYARALSSLKKYPLPLSSGKQAKILEFFGDKICAMLDARLLEWKQSNNSPASLQSSSETDPSSASGGSTSSPLPQARHASKTVKNKAPVRAVKRTFAAKSKTDKEQCEHIDVDAADGENSFYLFPGRFSVLLCVDNCETVSGQGRNKKLCISELQKSGVEYEVRKLHVGDFVWVARDSYDNSKELVLDYIVERKRMDDLASSIKDGRFREQKFRMKNCGLKNPIYLVENCAGAKYLGLPETTLDQAMVNTQIIDNFLIKRTQGIKESVAYLSLMTKMIKTKYQNLTLMSGSREAVKRKSPASNIFLGFNEFNTSSVKNKSLTVKEMFAKHLLQFFGLSVDRVAAIVEQYPTLSKFLEGYDRCENESEKVQMVSLIKYGIHKKNIGPALSKTLVLYYSPS